VIFMKVLLQLFEGFKFKFDGSSEYCGSLPATAHVIQWVGVQAWKVGGSVFAIGGLNDREAGTTFNVS
jgi:hypothetical protein